MLRLIEILREKEAEDAYRTYQVGLYKKYRDENEKITVSKSIEKKRQADIDASANKRLMYERYDIASMKQ